MDLEKLFYNFSEEIIVFLNEEDKENLRKVSTVLEESIECRELLQESFRDILEFMNKEKDKKQSKFGIILIKLANLTSLPVKRSQRSV